MSDSDGLKRNKKVNRPLSPHLSIYKPQITSLLSITHRATGAALFFGVIILALWVVLNVYGCASCINPLLKSTAGQVVLGLWAMALYYHMLNGIRHLFWDIGKGYSIPVVNFTGILVLLGTITLSAITFYFVYM